MIEIKLPFWIRGTQLTKLIAAAQSFWELAETWARWPLTQMDPLTCSTGVLDLLAFQRDIRRLKDEPVDLYRKRVKFALINNQDAGSKAGFIRIFQRLGIGYVEIEERVDPIDWDVILLHLSDSQVAQNAALLANIIRKYGRTCRRYQFATVTPLNTGIIVLSESNSVTYSYAVASL